MKAISNLVSRRKKSWFAHQQEACKKDVARTFGVLLDRFAIVRYPTLTWPKDHMWEVMTSSVILYNMIIESKREFPIFDTRPYQWMDPLADVDHDVSSVAFLAIRHEVRDTNTHHQPQDDMV
jgi:hypothetical protein